MRIRVGSLVMWNCRESEDYGCMGLVTSLWDSGESGNGLYFNVEWADSTVVEYGLDEIEDSNVKVVKI